MACTRRANMRHAGRAGRTHSGRPSRRGARHDRQGVGPHRLHRVRRAAHAHRHAASPGRRARGMDRRDRIRGCHRGDEPLAGAGIDAARHLLRLAAARPSRRAGGRRLLHLPGVGDHHRAGRAVPRLQPTDLGEGRRARGRGGGGARRRQRCARADPDQLAPCRSGARPPRALGGLRPGGRRRGRHGRHLPRPRAARLRAGGGRRFRWCAAAEEPQWLPGRATRRGGDRWAGGTDLGRAQGGRVCRSGAASSSSRSCRPTRCTTTTG